MNTINYSNNEIQLLSEEVSNQIAAGEVVERPASITKELIENSIDSGATEIIIDIQNGGRNIKVTDNGSGIKAEQVQLAFKRFATSKIKDQNDLWTLSTMGFRGEALASIASISKVEMKTRRREDDMGTKIVIHGNTIKTIEPTGCSYGTSILIEDLFYNTPARLKFLKSDNTEVSHILEFINAIVLSHPYISFSVINKSREVIRTDGLNSTIEDVVRQLYGKDFAQNLIKVDETLNFGKVTGLISKPSYSKSDKNKQIFFINNRWVKIPFLAKLLDDVYSDLIPIGKHPIAILNLEIPSSEIDVNVHPTKREVRFNNYSSVYELVYRSLMKTLYPTSQKIEIVEEKENNESFENKESFENYSPSEKTISQFAIEPVYQNRKTDNFQQKTLFDSQPNRFNSPPKEGTYKTENFSFFDELRQYKAVEENNESLENIKPIGVIYNNYIFGYLGSDLCFIDQHLAHERYLYEQLELDIKSKHDLLTTIMINLNEAQWESYEDNKDVFEENGYEIQEFGSRTIIIRAIPSVFELSEAEIAFREILQDLMNEENRKKSLDKFKQVKKTIACKAAIKAGDYIDMEEVKILIKNWAKTTQPYTCPHGRPIIYRLAKSEIDKHFNRTW